MTILSGIAALKKRKLKGCKNAEARKLSGSD